MPTIFDLEAELVQIAEAFDQIEGQEETPEILAAIEAYFGQLLSDRDAKVDGYCRLITDFTAKAKAKKAEAERVAALAKADEAAADRLKARLKVFMEASGMTKLDGALHKVAIQSNGGKRPVQINPIVEQDPTKAPPEFQKVVVALDGDKVRAALESIEAEISERLAVLQADWEADSLSPAEIDERRREVEFEMRSEHKLGFANLLARGTHVRIR